MAVPPIPKVSVIIVNWNGQQHLVECLQSLAQQSYQNFETVLVDNGSKDDSLKLLSELFPQVVVVPLDENTGFAQGNNIGYAHAQGEYIVTLNNDTKVDGNWLKELVRVADEAPNVGMVGCRICSYDDPDLIDSLGILVCRDGMSRGAYRNQKFSSLELTDDFEIFFPSACAALYKREMIEQIGFFDEDFFAYCEDTDLGLRGRWGGWSAVLAVDAVVLHKYSQSTGSLSPFKVYHVERNHYWVVLKNMPLSWLLMLPFYTVVRFAIQFNHVVVSRGTGDEFKKSSQMSVLLLSVLRAFVGALWKLPSMLRSRRGIVHCSRRRLVVDCLKRFHLSFANLLDG